MPLWNVLLVTITIVLIAIEAGYRIGLWRNRSREFDSEAQLSSMTGAHLALLTLSMPGIGYFSGMKGSRNPVASTGLALSFSLVMFLIADLDRPTSGLVQADHSVMLELDQRLNR